MADQQQKKADFKKKFAGVKKTSDGDGLPKLSPCRIKVDIKKSDDETGKRVDSQITLFGNSALPYGETNPFLASIEAAEYYTPIASTTKRVISVTLNIAGSGMQYQPGDYMCVVCTNPIGLVGSIAARLCLDLDDIVTVEKVEGIPDAEGFPSHLKTPCTVRHMFTNYCDFTVAPTKKMLRMLGENSTGEDDKTKLLHLASTAGRDDYIKFVNTHPTLFDILSSHPTCTPPLAHLIDLLSPLTPRDYSISSSPLPNPSSVSLLFSVVEFLDPSNKLVKGICTNWLEAQVLRKFPHLDNDPAHQTTTTENLAADVSKLGIHENIVKIPVFHKASAFRLSDDLKQPLILVGPGSGVAPFLGFVDHRHFQHTHNKLEVGPIYLFFGCRLSSTDYLSMRNHLTNLETAGSITKFVCAFSRDDEGEIVYVQHKLVEHGEEVFKLMTQNNAKLYVCGDAKGMALGVKDALVSIIKTHSQNAGDKEALEILASWSKEKRYILDVWF